MEKGIGESGDDCLCRSSICMETYAEEISRQFNETDANKSVHISEILSQAALSLLSISLVDTLITN